MVKLITSFLFAHLFASCVSSLLCASGIESRVLEMLGKHPLTELHPSFLLFIYLSVYLSIYFQAGARVVEAGVGFIMCPRMALNFWFFFYLYLPSTVITDV